MSSLLSPIVIGGTLSLTTDVKSALVSMLEDADGASYTVSDFTIGVPEALSGATSVVSGTEDAKNVRNTKVSITKASDASYKRTLFYNRINGLSIGIVSIPTGASIATTVDALSSINTALGTAFTSSDIISDVVSTGDNGVVAFKVRFSSTSLLAYGLLSVVMKEYVPIESQTDSTTLTISSLAGEAIHKTVVASYSTLSPTDLMPSLAPGSYKVTATTRYQGVSKSQSSKLIVPSNPLGVTLTAIVQATDVLVNANLTGAVSSVLNIKNPTGDDLFTHSGTFGNTNHYTQTLHRLADGSSDGIYTVDLSGTSSMGEIKRASQTLTVGTVVTKPTIVSTTTTDAWNNTIVSGTITPQTTVSLTLTLSGGTVVWTSSQTTGPESNPGSNTAPFSFNVPVTVSSGNYQMTLSAAGYTDTISTLTVAGSMVNSATLSFTNPPTNTDSAGNVTITGLSSLKGIGVTLTATNQSTNQQVVHTLTASSTDGTFSSSFNFTESGSYIVVATYTNQVGSTVTASCQVTCNLVSAATPINITVQTDSVTSNVTFSGNIGSNAIPLFVTITDTAQQVVVAKQAVTVSSNGDFTFTQSSNIGEGQYVAVFETTNYTTTNVSFQITKNYTLTQTSVVYPYNNDYVQGSVYSTSVLPLVFTFTDSNNAVVYTETVTPTGAETLTTKATQFSEGTYTLTVSYQDTSYSNFTTTVNFTIALKPSAVFVFDNRTDSKGSTPIISRVKAQLLPNEEYTVIMTDKTTGSVLYQKTLTSDARSGVVYKEFLSDADHEVTVHVLQSGRVTLSQDVTIVNSSTLMTDATLDGIVNNDFSSIGYTLTNEFMNTSFTLTCKDSNNNVLKTSEQNTTYTYYAPFVGTVSDYAWFQAPSDGVYTLSITTDDVVGTSSLSLSTSVTIANTNTLFNSVVVSEDPTTFDYSAKCTLSQAQTGITAKVYYAQDGSLAMEYSTPLGTDANNEFTISLIDSTSIDKFVLGSFYKVIFTTSDNKDFTYYFKYDPIVVFTNPSVTVTNTSDNITVHMASTLGDTASICVFDTNGIVYETFKELSSNTDQIVMALNEGQNTVLMYFEDPISSSTPNVSTVNIATLSALEGITVEKTITDETNQTFVYTVSGSVAENTVYTLEVVDDTNTFVYSKTGTIGAFGLNEVFQSPYAKTVTVFVSISGYKTFKQSLAVERSYYANFYNLTITPNNDTGGVNISGSVYAGDTDYAVIVKQNGFKKALFCVTSDSGATISYSGNYVNVSEYSGETLLDLPDGTYDVYVASLNYLGYSPSTIQSDILNVSGVITNDLIPDIHSQITITRTATKTLTLTPSTDSFNLTTVPVTVYPGMKVTLECLDTTTQAVLYTLTGITDTNGNYTFAIPSPTQATDETFKFTTVGYTASDVNYNVVVNDYKTATLTAQASVDAKNVITVTGVSSLNNSLVKAIMYDQTTNTVVETSANVTVSNNAYTLTLYPPKAGVFYIDVFYASPYTSDNVMQTVPNVTTTGAAVVFM